MPFIVLAAIVVAVVVWLALWVGGRRSGAPVARWLRLVAVILTLVVAAVVAAPAWDDSGSFALVLVGIPVGCAAIVLMTSLVGRSAALAAWVAGGVMMLWGLLTGLGLGAYFLVPAVLMIAAAAASTGEARRSTTGEARPGAH